MHFGYCYLYEMRIDLQRMQKKGETNDEFGK